MAISLQAREATWRGYHTGLVPSRAIIAAPRIVQLPCARFSDTSIATSPAAERDQCPVVRSSPCPGASQDRRKSNCLTSPSQNRKIVSNELISRTPSGQMVPSSNAKWNLYRCSTACNFSEYRSAHFVYLNSFIALETYDLTLVAPEASTQLTSRPRRGHLFHPQRRL